MELVLLRLTPALSGGEGAVICYVRSPIKKILYYITFVGEPRTSSTHNTNKGRGWCVWRVSVKGDLHMLTWKQNCFLSGSQASTSKTF